MSQILIDVLTGGGLALVSTTIMILWAMAFSSDPRQRVWRKGR